MFHFLLKTYIASLMLSVVMAGSLRAQDDDTKPAPQLPTDKNLWLNSSPYTWEQLKGKGVCLFFFQCDSEGLEEIPKHLEAARLHALDPVLFIGVSMGSDRQNTERYLRGTKYNWPTLCDPQFTYSRQCDTSMGVDPGDGVLGSVCAANYVSADGKMSSGWWDDPEATVAEALMGAAWVTTPKEIPEPLLPLWRAVEFRKYTEALPLFKKGLSGGPEPQRETARKLHDLVTAEIDRLAGEVHSFDDADDKWNAYSLISRIEADFNGYDLPKDLDPLQKKLLRNSRVKAGVLVEKQFPTMSQNLSSPNAAIRGKARSQLEKVVTDFPDSDLSRRAQGLLDTPAVAPK